MFTQAYTEAAANTAQASRHLSDLQAHVTQLEEEREMILKVVHEISCH